MTLARSKIAHLPLIDLHNPSAAMADREFETAIGVMADQSAHNSDHRASKPGRTKAAEHDHKPSDQNQTGKDKSPIFS